MAGHTHRRYIIFGADGDIGRATVKSLREAGAKAMLVEGPNAPQHTDACGANEDGWRLSVDATSSLEVKRAFDVAIDTFGDLDGVVHCIGSFGLDPIEQLTDDKIEAILATNLRSAIFVGREVAQRFKHAVGFSAVFVSSAAAQYGMPSQEVLSAAKGGVEALVRSLASGLAPGARVNGVAPGLINTSATKSLRSAPDKAEKSKAMFPAQQFGDSDQVAETVAFMLDERHSFITGQVWCVDGGLTTVQAKPREQVEAKVTPKPDAPPAAGVRRQIEEQRQFAEDTATG